MSDPRFHGHQWLKRTKQGFGVALFLLGVWFAGLYVYSTRFVSREVYLKDESVGGKTHEEARAIIQEFARDFENAVIVLKDGGAVTRLHRSAFGIEVDQGETLRDLLGSGASDLKAQLLSANHARQEKTLAPALKMNREEVMRKVKETLQEREWPATDAILSWSPETGWGISESRPGRKLIKGEAERITDLILKGALEFKEGSAYHAQYETIDPKVTTADLSGMLNEAQTLEKDPVEARFGKIKETIDVRLASAEWFTFDYEAKKVMVNTEKVSSYAADFASRYTIAPATVTFKGFEEIPSEYAKGEAYKKAILEGEMRSGRQILQDPLVSDLSALLTKPGKRILNIQFETVPVTIESEVPEITFPERISMGQSNFHLGNHYNRVHNIKTALAYEDLTVIAPGETFSYDKVLGWVTPKKGYLKAHVIFGDTLVDAPGGGVCQTSTTMFRAAVNAGLPIVKRRNHTWDVVYYRDWYGVDAAVYPPGRVDLMFTNDTPGYILVHSYADDDTEMAYFELYGTHDGRTVTFDTVENVKIGRGRKIVTDWMILRSDGTEEKRQIVSRYIK